MNVAAYCRVSTDKEDQLNSLEAQKEFFEEYTKKQGHHLVQIYADEGLSGTKIKNRTGFLRMMQDAHEGMFDMVLVKDISRLARNTVDLLNSTRELKALNIDMLFLTSNMTVMDNSEFMLTIFGALAQEESSNTSKRVKFGKRQNAKKGKVPNRVFGYDKTIGDLFHLSINETEAEIVRKIFDLYLHEGYGTLKISNILNRENLKTKNGCDFSKNAVVRILSNPLYTGKVINGKQEVADFLTGKRRDIAPEEWLIVERPELRIVEPEDFEEAQRILRERQEAAHSKKNSANGEKPFGTLIHCLECGYPYRRMRPTEAHPGGRWVCSARYIKEEIPCRNRAAVDENMLLKKIRSYFSDLLENKERTTWEIQEAFERKYGSLEENEQQKKEVGVRLEKLRADRRKYVDLFGEELITKDELKFELNGTKREMDGLEREAKKVQERLDMIEQMNSLIETMFSDIAAFLDAPDPTREILERSIQRITVRSDGKCEVILKLFEQLGHVNRKNLVGKFKL